jgi:hypothetical protein
VVDLARLVSQPTVAPAVQASSSFATQFNKNKYIIGHNNILTITDKS